MGMLASFLPSGHLRFLCRHTRLLYRPDVSLSGVSGSQELLEKLARLGRPLLIILLVKLNEAAFSFQKWQTSHVFSFAKEPHARTFCLELKSIIKI